MKITRQLAVVIATVSLFGWPTPGAAQQVKAKAKAGGAAAAAKRPRVFFVEPKSGATVTSPVHLKFGVQNFEIAAVPAGDVTKARPGVGHYHVGIDQSCLTSGKVIVKGTPSWVHLGDGKDEIDMQLAPGRHKLALQIGDDLHKTVRGLCSSITVNVSK
jgi:Domain of unknown function (DUF4399)/Family of unknown function (DUF6130)